MGWELMRAIAWRDEQNDTVPWSPCSESVKQQTYACNGVDSWHQHFAYVIIDGQGRKKPDEAEMDRRVSLKHAP